MNSATHMPRRLPALLLALTLGTGLVDAFSYLVLGHVFVANMTGNIVFLGFALAGAQGFSIAASGVAVVAFACGAVIGGRLAGHFRQQLLSAASTLQALFVATAVVLTLTSNQQITTGDQYALIVVLATAMGIQNAAARKLAVPDMTTTVLTMTITGLGADSRIAGGGGAHPARRMASVIAMLLGALAGALLIVHGDTIWPLVLELVVCGVVAAAAVRLVGRAG